MGSPVPLSAAQQLRPDARIDILDVNVEINAVVTCRCPGGKTFLVSGHVPGLCTACTTVYAVKGLKIQKPLNGPTDVAVQIGPKDSSPIVAPGGGVAPHRN